MSYTNIGNQAIVWQFETPLNSLYLSQGLYGAFSPGFVACPNTFPSDPSDPAFRADYAPGGRLEFLPNVWTEADDPGAVLVGPLSLFTVNRFARAGASDADMVFKVSTSSNVRVLVEQGTVAIGYSYEYRPQPDWWGLFEALDVASAANYRGVIICAVGVTMVQGSPRVDWVDPLVCDKSDTLFHRRGFEPKGHLSPLSPRDPAFATLNTTAPNTALHTFVLRDFNDALTDFVARTLRPPGNVVATSIATMVNLLGPGVFIGTMSSGLTVGHRYAVGYEVIAPDPNAPPLELRVVASAAPDGELVWDPRWAVLGVVTWGGTAQQSTVTPIRIQGGMSFISSDLPVMVHDFPNFDNALSPFIYFSPQTQEFCEVVRRDISGVVRMTQERWRADTPQVRDVRPRNTANTAWEDWRPLANVRDALPDGSWRMSTPGGGSWAWDAPTRMLSYVGPAPNSPIFPGTESLSTLGLSSAGPQGRIRYLAFTIQAGAANFTVAGGTRVGVRNIWATDASGVLRHYRTIGRNDFNYTDGDELAVLTDVWAAIDQLSGGLQPPVVIPHIGNLPTDGMEIGDHFIIQDMGASYNNSAGAAWWSIPPGQSDAGWQFISYKNFAPDGSTTSLNNGFQLQVHPTLMSRIATIEATANGAVARSGDTMTGDLTMPASANPVNNNTVARQSHLFTQLGDEAESSVNLPTTAGQGWRGLKKTVRNVLRFLLARVRNPAGASQPPVMDGVVAVGDGVEFARWNHRHPTDTGRAPVESPTFTGTPRVPTKTSPATNDGTLMATEAQVALAASNAVVSGTAPISVSGTVISIGAATQSAAGSMSAVDKSKLDGIANNATANAPSTSNPQMDGVASPGTAPEFSRGNHVHPTDTSRAPINNPTFTGNVRMPPRTGSPVDDGTIPASEAQVLAAMSAAVVSGTAPISVSGTVISIGAATQSAAGSMSAVDKSKLDGIANNANNYTHPSHAARSGFPAGDQAPPFGSTFIVGQTVSDESGHVTDVVSRTVMFPTLPIASASAAGIVRLGTGASDAAVGDHGHTRAGVTDFAHTHAGAANGGDLGNNIVGTAQISALAVTNAEIADNTIQLAKIARTGTAGQLLRSGGTEGDVSWVDAPTSYPGDGLDRLGDLVATRLVGRASGDGSGPAQQLTAATVRTMLNVANGAQVNQRLHLCTLTYVSGDARGGQTTTLHFIVPMSATVGVDLTGVYAICNSLFPAGPTGTVRSIPVSGMRRDSGATAGDTFRFLPLFIDVSFFIPGGNVRVARLDIRYLDIRDESIFQASVEGVPGVATPGLSMTSVII